MSVLGDNTDQALLDYMGHNLLSNSNSLFNKFQKRLSSCLLFSTDCRFTACVPHSSNPSTLQTTTYSWELVQMFIAQHWTIANLGPCVWQLSRDSYSFQYLAFKLPFPKALSTGRFFQWILDNEDSAVWYDW